MRQHVCGSCGGGAPVTPNNGPSRRRGVAYLRRDSCCTECANGLHSYPAGGDAAADAAARAAREAADRQAALNAFGSAVTGVSSGVNAGFATETARIQAEAETARARAEAQAATERARIEAARDVELARLRASQPNVSLAPLETASTPAQQPAQVTTRTDSGSGSFPVVPVAIAGGVGLLLWWASKKKGR